jgi:hypothetical protein
MHRRVADPVHLLLSLATTVPIAKATFQQEDLAFLNRHEHSTHSARCRLLRAGALSLAHTLALRAWLLSACPSGTKAIRPSKRHTIILALMG